jgi:ABC-type dipeptide/oligopeptide/nickel transport system permease subunit
VIYVVMGVLGWANVARIVRGQVLQVMRMSYIDAARMMCASPLRIALTHVLPNILGPVVVFGTVQVGNYILMEGSLSFLGVGVPPPTPSLGSMIFEGKQYFMAAPWMILYPGLLLSALVIGFNLLGDGLGDVLIPHHDD